jgi:hypothetical protein
MRAIAQGRTRAVLLGVLAICVLAPVAAHAFVFSAPRYSILEGERSGSDVFKIGGIEQVCKQGYFNGNFSSRTLEVEPVFDECTAKALAGMTSNYVLYKCTFQVRAVDRPSRKGAWEAPVDLECPTTYKLRWQVFESQESFEGGKNVCTTTVPPQKNIGTAEVTNMKGSRDDITIRWDLSGMRYETYGSALYCGGPEGATRQGASYRGYATIRATDLAGRKPQDLAVHG